MGKGKDTKKEEKKKRERQKLVGPMRVVNID